MKRAFFALALAGVVLWAISLWPLVALLGAAWLFSLLITAAFFFGYGVYFACAKSLESAVVVEIKHEPDPLIAKAERLAKSSHVRTQ